MPALGLHLKPSGFAAVEIDFKKDRRTLLKSAFSDFTDFRLNTANDASVSAYIERLKEFIYDNNFKSKGAVAALPQEEVFVRTIKVPVMNDKDLDNFIKYESAQYIPLPLEEVTLGYDRMPVDITSRDKTSVLLVAAKKETVKNYIHIVRGADLTPLAMEPESLAMTRALKTPSGEAVAELIVEVGQEQTLIVLSYNGYVVLTRTVPFGDLSMVRALEQNLDLDITQAMEYKNTYGLDSTKVEGKVYSVLAPVFDKVIAEIKKSRVFFTSQNPNIRIDKVIVSGQTALMPGLLVYMVNNFNIEVELANPWVKFDLETSSQKDEIVQNGPIFAVPVGLALKVNKADRPESISPESSGFPGSVLSKLKGMFSKNGDGEGDSDEEAVPTPLPIEVPGSIDASENVSGDKNNAPEDVDSEKEASIKKPTQDEESPSPTSTSPTQSEDAGDSVGDGAPEQTSEGPSEPSSGENQS
jgi:type IV pilus assembly protein PilM